MAPNPFGMEREPIPRPPPPFFCERRWGFWYGCSPSFWGVLSSFQNLFFYLIGVGPRVSREKNSFEGALLFLTGGRGMPPDLP